MNSVEDAIKACGDVEEVMIMGGASLYEQLLPQVERLYLTQVHASLEGDTWFPDRLQSEWQEISREDHLADDKNDYPYSFLIFDRV